MDLGVAARVSVVNVSLAPVKGLLIDDCRHEGVKLSHGSDLQGFLSLNQAFLDLQSTRFSFLRAGDLS